MKKTFYPHRVINASVDIDLEYDVSAEDPADWYIDYDSFFALIDEAISTLGLDIEDVEENYTRGGEIRTYMLTNGAKIDSYDLEVNLLYGLEDGSVEDSTILQYITDYIKRSIKR